MARYTGPKSKIARRFKDPIFGPDKALEKRSYGPGQHGPNKRRGKQSEYAIQLGEKQKAKYTYGILERQFSNMFKKASRISDETRQVVRLKGSSGGHLLFNECLIILIPTESLVFLPPRRSNMFHLTS